MNNTIERQRIVLAALLHDIGKFWQRADEKYSESEIIKNAYPNSQFNHTVNTYDNGMPKYVHALWTNAFFDQTKTGKVLKLDNESNIGNIAANHHRPNIHQEAIISMADRWSSGIDRPDEGEEGVSGYSDVKKMYGNDFVRKVGMHSIFDTIDKAYSEIEKHHTFPLKPLNINKEKLFPSERKIVSIESDYKELWRGFYAEYMALIDKAQDFDAFYISLLTLLKKYTWCIPSATNLLPSNVSLYEHLKSTAALALGLYDYCEDNKIQLEVNENNGIRNIPKDDPLLMVCVDVSGIQKFIYDIANKKAAASLKGRSFYIEMLIQNTVDEVLNHKDIKAYRSSIIYSSGGKAYLILSNIDKVKTALEELQKKISKQLFSETEGRLFVSIGYNSFRYTSSYGTIIEGPNKGKEGFINILETSEDKVLNRYGVINGSGVKPKDSDKDTFNLSFLWRSVSDKAAERKNRKFENELKNNFDHLFLEGEDFRKEQKKCSVLGSPIKGIIEYLDGDKNLPVSQIVYDQVELGKDLRNAKFIEYRDDAKYTTADLGSKFSLQSSNHENTLRIYLNEWPDFSRHKGGQGQMFYGGNYQPAFHNRSKTFEELCYIDEGNDTKFAVLRMDVDNLGQIFISGIRNKSFASYATLSLMLDTFFAGYINTIQLREEKYREHIQILYSGGDDVFAVGRWDAIIELAADIREEFRDFVKRDDITISAGISIVNAKYPISKAAADAGEAEKKAKAFNGSNGSANSFADNSTLANKFARPLKNAIDVFGETIGWGKEWKEVDSLRQSFEYFEKDTGRALIHSIQNFKIRKDENLRNLKEGREKNLSYIWHSGYQLSRLMDRLKKNKEAKDFVKNIRDRILHDKNFGADRFLDLAALAARWAEYNLKDNNGSAN